MKVTTNLCKIMDLGMNGTLFGGQLMYWLDETAAVYAAAATGESRIVTRRFSETLFQKPIRLGEIIEFHCINPVPGNTSFSFRILAKVGGDIKFQADCTFVAVDKDGKKKPIDWSKAPVVLSPEKFS